MCNQGHSGVRWTVGCSNPSGAALAVLLLMMAGCLGYYAGAMRETAVDRLSANGSVALRYLVAADSFSEVEQARAVLDALADRYVESAQMLITRDGMRLPLAQAAPESGGKRPLIAAIELLEEAAAEFEGSGEELQLLPTLLCALKRDQRHDRWLDVYLDTLYRHPTQNLIGYLADEAVLQSREVGREREVVAAFRHVVAIPWEFSAKAMVEHCLVCSSIDFQTAAHETEPILHAPES